MWEAQQVWTRAYTRGERVYGLILFISLLESYATDELCFFCLDLSLPCCSAASAPLAVQKRDRTGSFPLPL